MLKTFDFEKMPVVEIVNEIMVDAAKRGASDIHFDALPDYMKVRIRIDGLLVNYTAIPNSIKKNLITRIKIISGMNITESRLPQDGAIKATIQDIELDLRVSSLPTSEGEKIVIRILDYTMSLSGLETLGFSESNYHKVLQMINVPNGIVLVTGATGSGKSTTVYSILQKLNKEDTNIITVEDPIEMDIDGINQVQTNSEIGLTFATALRSILRQDPNIIMIGEIRDTETAKIAVRASITGHLVLSTLHTNNSLNTLERLFDMGVERYLLSSSLTGIISQKLARRLCPKCKKLRPTNDYEKELFKKVLNKDINEIYDTVGCEECGNGYHGRIAIHEVLLINQEIKDAVSSGVKKDVLRELVYKSDVTTLLQDGLEKVVNGITTFEELLKIIELDDDDKLAGNYDLKKALDYTNITQQTQTNQNVNVTPSQTTQQPNSYTNVTPTQVQQPVNNTLNQTTSDIQTNNYQSVTPVQNLNQNNIQQNNQQPRQVFTVPTPQTKSNFNF
ncbi:MAG: type II/IV secretion system protein [Bacilli bacterium]|nr:type II/IV secretion system protein [Bacilli bacterium]